MNRTLARGPCRPRAGFADKLTAKAAYHAETVLALALLAGPPSLRRRDIYASVQGEIDLAVAVQIAVWTSAAVWILMLMLRPGARPGSLTVRIPRLPWVVAGGCCLAAALALSASVSPAPAFSLFRSFQVGTAALAAFWLVRRRGAEEAFRLLRRGLALLAYAIFVVYLVRPDLVLRPGGYFGIRGDVVAPANTVGVLLFVLVLTWPFADRAEARQRAFRPLKTVGLLFDNRQVLFVLAVSLTLLSRSRIGLVLLLVCGGGMLVLGAHRRRVRVWILLLLVLATLTLTVVAAWDVVVAWVVRDPRQLAHLSHRLPLWRFLVETTVEESPVIGLGYFAASRVLGPQAVKALGNAHSSFVEVFVGGGALALIVYAGVWTLFLLQSLLCALRHRVLATTLLFGSASLLAFATLTSHLVAPSPASFVFWVMAAVVSSPGQTRQFAQRLRAWRSRFQVADAV